MMVWPPVSSTQRSGDDSSFSLPDVALPPGLEAPPGLAKPTRVSSPAESESTDVLTPPPGLPDQHHTQSISPSAGAAEMQHELVEEPIVEVSIIGIPDKLLSETMVEAMLDQICMDASRVSFTIRRSKPSGCVSALFSDVNDAQRCVAHFHGQKWDRKAEPVHAHMWPLPAASMPKLIQPTLAAPPVPSSVFKPRHNEPAVVQVQGKMLSADAPTFEPSSKLSAGSPAFIRFCEVKGSALPTLLVGHQLSANSETSTDLGESETEDEICCKTSTCTSSANNASWVD